MYLRTMTGLAAFFGVLAACRCNATIPTPSPVTVVVGEADIPIQIQVCANLQAYCPSSMPDGGLEVCEQVVLSRYGLTPATMPTVLMCEARAASKDAFYGCQGVATCP